MTDIDVRIIQRSLIGFLTAEGELPTRIHERLKNVYGDATVDVSTVRRWFIVGFTLKMKRPWNRPCVNGLGDKTLLFTGLEYMPLLKGGPKTVEMDGDYIEKWQINRQCCDFQAK
jgi:hypothetical protein